MGGHCDCVGTEVQLRIESQMTLHIVCELHMETVVWELVSAFSTQPCLKDDFLLCSDAYLREAIQILSK